MKMIKDLQHEVLLPAGQVAPDSDGSALHILYFESHISVELLCKTTREEDSVNPKLLLLKCCYISKHICNTHLVTHSCSSAGMEKWLTAMYLKE